MEMKTPYTNCELKTDEHLLIIRRGSSPRDYSWELYSNDTIFDRGVTITGEHFCGGSAPSFSACIRAAEGFGFGINMLKDEDVDPS